MFLNQENGYKDTYEYQQVMDHRYKSTSEKDALSTALRLVIHYSGDVHQPLHGSSRVDHEYPAGDRGGNSFPLPSKDGAKNLHAIWDSVLYEGADDQDFKLPLDPAQWANLGSMADDFVARHPVNTLDGDINDLNPHHWAHESFEVAEKFVYDGISEGKAVSESYVSQGKTLAEKQIVKAGYRLANLIKTLKLVYTQDSLFL